MRLTHRQPSDASRVLRIAYLPSGAAFVLPVLTRLQGSEIKEVRAKAVAWRNSDVSALAAAIATKLSQLSLVNRTLAKATADLYQWEREENAIATHSARGFAWRPAGDLVTYRVLVAIDAFFFEFRSAYEILVKFLSSFSKHILGRSLDKERVFGHLRSLGVPTDWVEDLRQLRAKFFHDSPPWIALHFDTEMVPEPELLILTSPDADVTDPDQCLPLSRLQAIYAGFEHSLRELHRWALAEIDSMEEQVRRRE